MARWAGEVVAIVFHPAVEGKVGATEEEIGAGVNRAGYESAGQDADMDLFVA